MCHRDVEKFVSQVRSHTQYRGLLQYVTVIRIAFTLTDQHQVASFNCQRWLTVGWFIALSYTPEVKCRLVWIHAFINILSRSPLWRVESKSNRNCNSRLSCRSRFAADRLDHMTLHSHFTLYFCDTSLMYFNVFPVCCNKSRDYAIALLRHCVSLVFCTSFFPSCLVSHTNVVAGRMLESASCVAIATQLLMQLFYSLLGVDAWWGELCCYRLDR